MHAQAAEASAAVAAASACLGTNAAQEAAAALLHELPLVLGAAPKQVQGRCQLDLAKALLSCASEAELQEDPHRCLQLVLTIQC